MGVDWGHAGQVGGAGFGIVFAVLIILALAMWIVGLVLKRIAPPKEAASDTKKKGA